MDGRRSTLQLRPAVLSTSRGDLHHLDLVVDGTSFQTLAGREGATILTRVWPGAPPSPLEVFGGRTADDLAGPGRVSLLTCSICADLDCGVLTTTLEIGPDEVTWSDFRWVTGYDDDVLVEALPSPMRFDREAYARAGPGSGPAADTAQRGVPASSSQMVAAVNVLRLRNEVDGPFVEVVPYVDGVSLVDLVSAFETRRGHDVPGSYAGLARDWEFDAGRWLPSSQPSAVADLLGCECGEAGCWPLVARVRAVGDQVIWDSFSQPHRPDRDYTGFGPFTFDARQYTDALGDPQGRRSR